MDCEGQLQIFASAVEVPEGELKHFNQLKSAELCCASKNESNHNYLSMW